MSGCMKQQTKVTYSIKNVALCLDVCFLIHSVSWKTCKSTAVQYRTSYIYIGIIAQTNTNYQ